MGADRPRYAIYYAPVDSSALWAFGNGWFGRDADGGTPALRQPLNGFDHDWIGRVTATAATYGFHATLKPPFRLAPGRSWAALDHAVRRFAATRSPVIAPTLVLGALDEFVALLLAAPSPAVTALAADCVRALDGFRQPPSAEELARRRMAGLSARQDALLVRWGYPYVMQEWRFHMTLTERLPTDQRGRLIRALRPMVARFCGRPLTIEAISVFRQAGAGEPFVRVARYPLVG